MLKYHIGCDIRNKIENGILIHADGGGVGMGNGYTQPTVDGLHEYGYGTGAGGLYKNQDGYLKGSGYGYGYNNGSED